MQDGLVTRSMAPWGWVPSHARPAEDLHHDIDQVKSLLDQKTEQKNQHEITKSMAPGFTSVDDGLDASPNDINEVIDEEEL